MLFLYFPGRSEGKFRAKKAMEPEFSTVPEVKQPGDDGSTRKAFRANAAAVAKKIVPRRVIQEIRRYRQFKKSERGIYLRLRLAHELGVDSRKVPSSARSLVFVCFGNIMRSPMAEALLKQALALQSDLEVSVTSAGLNATPGKSAHPWAIAAAQEFGISLENHHAVVLTRKVVNEADAILAMDFQNQVEFLARFPHAARKLFLLGAYVGSAVSSVEIRDPFFGDLEETRRCYGLMHTCIQNLGNSLHAESHSKGSR